MHYVGFNVSNARRCPEIRKWRNMEIRKIGRLEFRIAEAWLLDSWRKAELYIQISSFPLFQHMGEGNMNSFSRACAEIISLPPEMEESILIFGVVVISSCPDFLISWFPGNHENQEIRKSGIWNSKNSGYQNPDFLIPAGRPNLISKSPVFSIVPTCGGRKHE